MPRKKVPKVYATPEAKVTALLRALGMKQKVIDEILSPEKIAEAMLEEYATHWKDAAIERAERRLKAAVALP